MIESMHHQLITNSLIFLNPTIHTSLISIFAFLGIEPAVCVVVGKYLRIRVLTMPLDCFSISYEKYLMSIGVVQPSLVASICKIILLFFTDLYFVNHLKLGDICTFFQFGSPLLDFVALMVYIFYLDMFTRV